LSDYIALHSFDNIASAIASQSHCHIYVISATLHAVLQQERLVVRCLSMG